MVSAARKYESSTRRILSNVGQVLFYWLLPALLLYTGLNHMEEDGHFGFLPALLVILGALIIFFSIPSKKEKEND
jgi:Na+/melibiose symporter-like transporter